MQHVKAKAGHRPVGNARGKNQPYNRRVQKSKGIFQPISTNKHTYFPFAYSTVEEAVDSMQNRVLNFILLKRISNALGGKKKY